MKFQKVKQAIEDIKNGKMIVMVDDEDRENEGDLIFAATHSDVPKVNFAISECRGILCLAMDVDNAKRLDLPLMVSSNTSCHETAFTITIDAKECSTGVSAFERDITTRLAADPLSKPDDFVRPGHVFPLIAKNGGVLERIGHTEGSVDLCRLAGITPMACICEIVKEDGQMARREHLEEFCKKHGLNMVAVSDLVEYRLNSESLIDVNDGQMAHVAGFTAMKYEIKDHKNLIHTAFVFGDVKGKTSVKFQKITKDYELLSSEKFNDFIDGVKYLSENGGILVFLDSDKNEANTKDFGIGAQILKHFGISDIELLSTNKKDFVGISGFGLNIVSYR